MCYLPAYEGVSKRKSIESREKVKKHARNLSLVVGLIIIAAIAIIAGCGGQSDKTYDDAVAVVDQGNKALEDLNFKVYADLVDPTDLARFKTMIFTEIEAMAARTKADSIKLFDRDFDLDDMRQSDPRDFFANLMETIFAISPELGRSFSGMQTRRVGIVAENDSTIHVVVATHMEVGQKYVDEMNVSTARLVDGQWKAAMSPKIEGVGMMLQQSLQMQTR
ncbi:MAG: hypothetical protein AB1483_12865 [Candidatus Zixiibacteriota bacterium]